LYGILIDQVKGAKIAGNKFSNMGRAGILLRGKLPGSVDSIRIAQNTFRDTTFSSHDIMFATARSGAIHDVTIERNKFLSFKLQNCYNVYYDRSHPEIDRVVLSDNAGLFQTNLPQMKGVRFTGVTQEVSAIPTSGTFTGYDRLVVKKAGVSDTLVVTAPGTFGTSSILGNLKKGSRIITGIRTGAFVPGQFILIPGARNLKTQVIDVITGAGADTVVLRDVSPVDAPSAQIHYLPPSYAKQQAN
jgi:hypothetical protein